MSPVPVQRDVITAGEALVLFAARQAGALDSVAPLPAWPLALS